MRRVRRPRHRQRGDRGAVLILAGLVLVSLLIVSAIVIDLGATRGERRAGQAAVDNATASAGLAVATGADPATACEAAFDYLALTLETGAFTGASCGAFATLCVPTVGRSVTRTAADYTATVTYPVVPGSPLMQGASTIGRGPVPVGDDGGPCDRLAIQLTTSSRAYLGQIVGSTGRTSTVHAVGRIGGSSKSRPFSNLVVLDRTGCESLLVGGTGGDPKVLLSSPADNPTLPGSLAVDSDGSACGANNATVSINGINGSLEVRGPCTSGGDPNGPCGDIALFAPLANGSCAGTIDYPACREGNGSITPDAQQAAERVTRSPVDTRYNCLPSYASKPWFGVQPIANCSGASSSSDYVDELRQFVLAGPPAGWTVVTNCGPSTNTVYPPGNYYLDCARYKVQGSTTVTFAGGNVILPGTLEVNGDLTVHACALTSTCADSLNWSEGDDFDENSWSSEAAYFYIGGDVLVRQKLTMERVTVFQGPGARTLTQQGVINWSAPETTVAQSAGPFEDLAFWSDHNGNHQFAGGGSSSFNGIYFAPLGTFTFVGGGDVNLVGAQFVSNRMRFQGNATFWVVPLTTRALEFEPSSFGLIR